ncbi:hypothetical protein AAKU64_004161 [Undibacterium sp. GrIS 1.8]|uniref:hypothetical protein n=1 Tax=Undibacterium sp. GrIS 1.8 TaxID=3143934 RepID=UPI00339AD633
MDILSWFPALTTTGLFAAAVWFAREAISARLARSVQHEFDGKLEGVRSEFRASEERLKAQLREREAEITALRSGALSALASRQAALDKRRLEAVDQLWAAFNSLAPAKGIAASMSVVKFEAAAKEAERNPKARQLFEVIGAGFDQSKIDQSSADKARPFVSPMAWAVYAAYRAVTLHSVMRWHVLKGGLGAKDFTDREAIEKLVVAALPHYQEYIKQHGSDVYYNVLEGLEARLLSELQAMLSSSEFDKAGLELAAEIIRQANALQTATNEAEHAD